MKRSRFSQEQIIGILKEQEAGMPSAAGSAIAVWGIFWRARGSRRTTRSCCVSTARKACGCAAAVAASGRWARAHR